MDNNPWVEKFRPDEIEKIIMTDYQVKYVNTIVEELKTYVYRPLILTGTSGVGKTTTARCLARKMLGKYINDCFMELNAADERKSVVLKKTLPVFCQKIITGCSMKIILFDEADNITEKCQMELKDYMIKYKKVLFIFTCNESSKIITDIQSLSRRFEFHKLKSENIKKYLKIIADKEELEYTDKALDIIAENAEGDMRRGINDLYSCYISGKKITPSLVYANCNIPDPIYYKKIIDACANIDLIEADKHMNEIIDKGFNLIDIVIGLLKTLETYPDKEFKDDSDDKYNLNIKRDEYKIKLSEVVSQTKIDLVSGLRTPLQLKAMICKMIIVFKND